MRTRFSLAAVALAGVAASMPLQAQRHPVPLIDLWMQQKPAFGIFVPNEAPRPTGDAAGAGGRGAAGAAQGARPKPVYTQAGGEKMAANPLYDFVFLNLEGSYDGAAVKAIADGLRKGTGARKGLIVRVPAFNADPAQSRVRLREVFAAGADGITFPHVETVAEGKEILAAVQAEKINVWSPTNPKGDKLVMMMLEDPEAVAQAAEFADLKGYSMLACGIGSLRGALKGDAAGAEAGTQKVLVETRRTRLVNMLTATTQDVEQRIKEGFLGILAQGQNPDEAIARGRQAAGR